MSTKIDIDSVHLQNENTSYIINRFNRESSCQGDGFKRY